MNKFNFTVISFFTTSYSSAASRLKASCEKFGIPNQIIASAFNDVTPGDWRRNTFAKPEFIRSQMERIPGPVLWLDADAEIMRPPLLLNDLLESGFSISAYSRIPGKIRSGTIWFANDKITKGILDRWIKINLETYMMKRPSMAPDEQRNFYLAFQMKDWNSFWSLPLSYCRINGYSRDDQNECEDPAILHFQESRKYRGKK